MECLSQCVSPTRKVRRPSRSEYMAYLVHVTCVSTTTVSQLFEPQVQKNRCFHVPQATFLFPLHREVKTPFYVGLPRPLFFVYPGDAP